MFKLYAEDMEKEDRPEIFQTIKKEFKGDYAKFVENMFNKSIMSDIDKVNKFLQNPDISVLENDPAMQVALSVTKKSRELRDVMNPYYDQFGEGFRLYMAGLMEMNKGKAMYPDANFSMRMTYGSVKSYEAADAVNYNYVTTLKGVMEKEDPDNWEFVVPEKLKQLYEAKDFGRYAMKNGEMPVNFISTNDITGGNSGSPVLNGKGELIG